jgi:hypothetical protein
MVTKSMLNITRLFIGNTGSQVMTEEFFLPDTTECTMCGVTGSALDGKIFVKISQAYDIGAKQIGEIALQ